MPAGWPAWRPPEAVRVAIIADDLTGAMDTAAPFAARGLSTRVFPEGHAALEPSAWRADVVAVNTESRHSAAAQAAATVTACVHRLAQANPPVLLKKIDSTLRGNVATEIAAALEASGRPLAMVTPAMPAQSRTMREGRLYIRGIPLGETAIGRDRLSPPPTEPLIDLLRRQAPNHVWVGAKADAEAPSGASVVFDAETPEDMALIARRVLAAGDRVLACGSGGLGYALAELSGERRPSDAAVARTGPLLYVVGSRTPQAAAQIAALQASGDVAVVEPGGAAGHGAKIVVLRPAAVEGDAARVAAALAEAAARAIDTLSPSAVVMTGGDTALAVLRRLAVRSIEVSGEILPGIAVGTIAAGSRRLTIVTKAGGFGDADVFVSLRERLSH